MANWQHDLRSQFLVEAREHIEQLEAGLLGIGTSGLTREGLDALLRAAHSLKGGAAMMELLPLSHLAHRLEEVLNGLRSAAPLDIAIEEKLLRSIDALRRVVSLYQQGTAVTETWLQSEAEPLFDELQQHLGPPPPEEPLVPETEGNLQQTLFETEVAACLQRLETVLATPDQPCLREEILLAAQELGGLGEMLELDSWHQLCLSIQQQLEDSTTEQTEAIARSALEQWWRGRTLILNGQGEAVPTAVRGSVPEQSALVVDVSTDLAATSPAVPAEIEIASGLLPPSAQETVRVAVEQLDQFSNLFGVQTIERNGLEQQLQALRRLVGLLHQKGRVLQDANARVQTACDQMAATPSRMPAFVSSSGNDGLDMDRYSELHLLSQEVTEVTVQIQEIADDLQLGLEDSERTVRELGRNSKLMQKGLTQMRMRPLSELLDRFPRALREMELHYGKTVRLQVSGEATLIDRTILDVLNEPLLHLLRNAFAHGIEEPDQRRACGKPAQGSITIRARYRGHQVAIAVSDDGGGIPFNKIRFQARKRGYEGPLSQRELLNLIFEPGFSTAERVTNLAGRGVGMDVVRTNLRQIRGDIQVETRPGAGTTFTLTVPLSLSVLKVMLVEVNHLLLAFPTNTVEEVLLLKPEMLLQSAGKEFINVAGVVIPLVELRQWLQHPQVERGTIEAAPAIDASVALISTRGTHFSALTADRYWGEQEVTIRQVEGNLPLPPGFSGCTILGDGRVVPLVDAIALLNWIEQEQRRPEPAGFPSVPNALPQAEPNLPPTVMVVDDSATVRRFLALALERAGYRVEQAKNGQDGLEKLQRQPVQAVVCDLEMPGVDGYSFLSQVRASPDYQTLPVIILTSRSSDQHRSRAMELGANAYVVKPYKEPELLQLIEQVLQEEEREYRYAMGKGEREKGNLSLRDGKEKTVNSEQ
ncbi:MAG: response regulator [Cyanophyceae cyanobacterium]